MIVEIEPSERHFNIIKEIGSKCIIGLATVNAGPFICILSNYDKLENEWTATALFFLGIGTITAIMVGLIVLKMYLTYYPYESIVETVNVRKNIEEQNDKIETCLYVSILMPIFSILFFISGYNVQSANLAMFRGGTFLFLLFLLFVNKNIFIKIVNRILKVVLCLMLVVCIALIIWPGLINLFSEPESESQKNCSQNNYIFYITQHIQVSD